MLNLLSQRRVPKFCEGGLCSQHSQRRVEPKFCEGGLCSQHSQRRVEPKFCEGGLCSQHSQRRVEPKFTESIVWSESTNRAQAMCQEVKQSEEALRSVVSLLEKWVHAVVQECQTMMQLQEPFCLRVEALVACSDAALHL